MEIKQAIEKAFDHVVELFKTARADLTLEEVESNLEEKTWDITIGFQPTQPRAFVFPGSSWRSREYRVVRMKKDTGELVSIKLRPQRELPI